MDSVASFSFWVVGVVALAGQVLGSAIFCLEIMMYNNILNSIKKGPSSYQAVALGVLLASLKYEMSGTSLVTGVYIV